jgi:hypothetical protein
MLSAFSDVTEFMGATVRKRAKPERFERYHTHVSKQGPCMFGGNAAQHPAGARTSTYRKLL